MEFSKVSITRKPYSLILLFYLDHLGKKGKQKKKTGVEIETSKQIPPKGKESLISVSGGHRSFLRAICLLIMIAKSKENFSCLTNTTTK